MDGFFRCHSSRSLIPFLVRNQGMSWGEPFWDFLKVKRTPPVGWFISGSFPHVLSSKYLEPCTMGIPPWVSQELYFVHHIVLQSWKLTGEPTPPPGFLDSWTLCQKAGGALAKSSDFC